CTNDNILDKGETSTVSVTITNRGSDVLSGTTAQLPVISDHDVTFENDGLLTSGEVQPYEAITRNHITVTLNAPGTPPPLQL
ncbi:hypothetical protein R0J93_27280, partial [Pseudoalteromonas sp. SIMBA_148]